MIRLTALLAFFIFGFLAFGVQKTQAINYQSGQCYETPDNVNCTTNIPLSDCSTYGGITPNNVCHQVPWTFEYAARCRACIKEDAPLGSCDFNYEYEYNSCNTEDRCWGSNTGASGSDAQGRIIPGICSASSFDGTNPNSACISGGHYKQCCSNPSPGYTPTTSCSNGVCPNGYKTSANDTACDTPATPSPRFGCTGPGGSCVANSSGAYTTSNCDNKCITPCPGSGVPSSGWGGSCSPGSVQYPACGACGTCSVASCTQYVPNVYCWFNSGTCYNDPATCPNKCSICTPGKTQTLCYPNESTRSCNR